MSEVKVNKISPRTNCGTVQLGDSGDTITIPAGATIANNGTQTGFGRTGTVDWNTTKITADPANAVSGTGYFTDTSSAAFNVTLPSSPSAGDIVAVADYANTWDTNNLTIARNGSNIEGEAEDFVCNQEGASITFVYVDATKGWITVNAGNSSQAFVNNYIAATGGTITTDGDFKIHSFTGPGTFTVSSEGNACGSNTVDYLVVGGGGSGAGAALGGGGAGGFRMASCFSVCVQAYPITVGAGGAARGTPGGNQQNQGSNTIFSTITSAGGGAGGNSPPSQSPDLSKGGSGGGIGRDAYLAGRTTANNGNSPPVSPPQGNPGGVYAYSSPGTDQGSAGGGGAAGTGANGSPGNNGGNGGAGSPAAPVFGTAPKAFYIANGPANGASVCGQFAGGGGGGAYPGPSFSGGSGGVGGGGNGAGGPTSSNQNNGTANTGGGGGGNYGSGPAGTLGTSGGSGIVLIRYKFQN